MYQPIQFDLQDVDARDRGTCPRSSARPAGRPQPLPACRIRKGVRMHPVPRMNMCLVDAPGGATVHTLNLRAWRLLELCALEDLPRIRSAFLRSFRSPYANGQSQFERYLAQLVGLGIVNLVPREDRAACQEPLGD